MRARPFLAAFAALWLAIPAFAQAPATPAEQVIPLDRRASHPNGLILTVNSVTPRRTSILLNISVTTAGRESNLAAYGMLLADDQGGRYEVVVPSGNQNITVPANSAMEGELVFSGRLNPAARRLTLIVNERAGSPDNRVTTSPQLRVELPLPGQSGEADLPDEPKSSRVAVASLPVPPPLRVEALEESRLTVAAEAPGGTGFGAIRPGGGGGSGLGESRLSIVEQLRRDLDVRRTERGDLVSLPGDILFDFDKHDIRRDAEPTLDRLARLIAETRPTRVLVEGHTDSRGADAYNQRLSERRAEAVARWLAAQGTPAATLAPRGYGETRPVAPNARPNGADDPEGRQRNRRVEVVLQGGRG